MRIKQFEKRDMQLKEFLDKKVIKTQSKRYREQSRKNWI